MAHILPFAAVGFSSLIGLSSVDPVPSEKYALKKVPWPLVAAGLELAPRRKEAALLVGASIITMPNATTNLFAHTRTELQFDLSFIFPSLLTCPYFTMMRGCAGA